MGPMNSLACAKDASDPAKIVTAAPSRSLADPWYVLRCGVIGLPPKAMFRVLSKPNVNCRFGAARLAPNPVLRAPMETQALRHPLPIRHDIRIEPAVIEGELGSALFDDVV